MELNKAILLNERNYALFLIEQGFDVNLPDLKWGSTSLMLAVQKGDQELVKKYLTKGAKVQTQNKEGKSVKDFVRMSNYVEILKMLH